MESDGDSGLPTTHLQAPAVDSRQPPHGDAARRVNEELVASGLRVLRGPLAAYVCRGVESQYGDSWWTEGVLEILVRERTPNVEAVRKYLRLPELGTLEECADSLDINTCLILLTKHWYRIFAPLLSKDHRGWAFELIGVRNENKHLAGRDHPSDFSWRALDTMYRLVRPIDANAAKEILILRSSVDLSSYGQAPIGGSPTPNSVLRQHVPASETRTSVQADLEDSLAAVGPDFSGSDLRMMDFGSANLEGADFEGANLTGANLKGAKLVGANFKGATLADANLSTADLREAVFEGTALSAVFDKQRTYGSKAQSHGANLSGATLDNASLNFADCDLRSVDFGSANLEGADFEGANLTGANLKGAKLVGVNLRNAKIKDADMTDVEWT